MITSLSLQRKLKTGESNKLKIVTLVLTKLVSELSDISLVGQTKLVEVRIISVYAKKSHACFKFDLSRLSSCHSAGKAIVLTEYVADLEEQRTG